MTYDKGRLRFDRLSRGALLDWSAVLDEMVLDADDQSTPVDVSSVTLADGYTVGQGGELSIDPMTGTASMAWRTSGAVAKPAPPLVVGDRVEVTYDGVVLFRGEVAGIATSVEVDGDAARLGAAYNTRAVYRLASFDAALMAETVTWASLPEETALARLDRWFTVDVSGVAASHLARLDVLVPAVADAGASTLLDVARDFSAATLLPVRMEGYPLTTDRYRLEVIDTATDWDDAPLTATVGDSPAWTRAVEYEDGRPTAVEVVGNDTRLSSGQYTVTAPPALLDSSFFLDVSYLDESPTIAVGFLLPGVIDVLGDAIPVSRVTQTFGTTYDATLELAPVITLEAA